MKKILFAGDFCSSSPEKIILSKEVNDLFNSCDLKVLNFEGPLAKGVLDIPNKTILNQSSNSPNWCEDNGFNIISLANNHSLDFSQEGLIATQNAFKKSITLGIGTWEEAYSVKFINIDGLKIGYIAATSSDLASLKDKWTDHNKFGCASINNFEINKLIVDNTKTCDYLFVISHGGLEYMDVPLPEWRDRYRELIDLGADAIIAAHPHVPQGVETYNGKPIFYSLGNFYFDNLGRNKPLFWDNGICALIEIGNGKISHSLIPISRKNHTLFIDSSREINDHLKEITSILEDDLKYMDKVNSDLIELYPKLQQSLLYGFSSITITNRFKDYFRFVKRAILFKKNKPDLRIALHQLREESTRWALTRALKLLTNAKL